MRGDDRPLRLRQVGEKTTDLFVERIEFGDESGPVCVKIRRMFRRHLREGGGDVIGVDLR